MSKHYDTLLEAIVDNLVDGELPEEFILPGTKKEEIPFGHGALDSFQLYHKKSLNITDDILREIEEAVEQASKGSYEAAEGLFSILGQKYRAINMVKPLLMHLGYHSHELDVENIFLTAIYFLTESKDAECIKFALVILFGYRLQEEAKELVRLFGLCDEFTFYAATLMVEWKNGNHEIFELAKRAKGWGRIHAVNFLEPANKEMRDWLLFEGSKDTILSEYTALYCLESSGARKRLKKKATRREYTAIGKLISLIFVEERAPGISRLEDASGFLMEYLQQSKKQKLTIKDYENIHEVYMYAAHDAKDRALAEKARDIIHSDDCIIKVNEAIVEGEGVSLAKELNIPFEEILLERIQIDFDRNYTLCEFLIHEPKYTEKILELFRKEYPPETIFSKIEDKTAEEKLMKSEGKLGFILDQIKFLPMQGIDYLEIAIKGPTISERADSLEVLKNWTSIAKKPLRRLSPSLYNTLRNAYKEEVIIDIKNEMKDILG